MNKYILLTFLTVNFMNFTNLIEFRGHVLVTCTRNSNLINFLLEWHNAVEIATGKEFDDLFSVNPEL